MKHRDFLKTILALGVTLAALAGPARAQQKPDSSRLPARPAAAAEAPDLTGMLEAWVRMPPTARDRAEKLEYLRHWLGAPMLRDQLALIAADTSEPPLARASALIAIGEEQPTNLAVFGAALDDPDATVRAGAAAGLRLPLLDPQREPTARALLRRALMDRVPAVANRALESLGDRDADGLREFLAASPPRELAGIARQLLVLAESRGAPLVPRDSSGLLEREAAGVRLRFEPTGRWPELDAAQGRLSAAGQGKAPVVLATDVEVVRNVIPATVASDGRYVAYESGRHVHVRDLRSGTDRDLGPGIAPRVAPLAPGFLYFVPTKTTLERDRAALDYKVLFAPWAGGDSREVGAISASAIQGVSGNASPVRWARVVEGGSGFMIGGVGIVAPIRLPDLTASH